jgi:hypothetical protein
MVDIDPVVYCETEFGVFVSKSPRDVQNLEMVRQQVQAFAQNGMAPSTLIDVVRARSLSKLQTILKEKEQEAMTAQQQAQVSEQEAAERQIMIQEQYKELEGVIQERLINVEYDRKEDLEHIKGAYSTFKNVEGDGDNNNNGIPDAAEVQANLIQAQGIFSKEQVEREKIRSTERQKARELDLKERELKLKNKDIDTRLQETKIQAKTALKNKVAGEKSKSK